MALHFHKNKLWSVLDVIVAAVLVWRGVQWMRVAGGPNDLPSFTLGILGFYIACVAASAARATRTHPTARDNDMPKRRLATAGALASFWC